ncbi:hypothetical protein LEP1GSC062_3774 [Leptospira alexanderi serovar Manhao 3 str. L 60]|uniref:Uncharacterized protein n=1 Tax=Leptospira alexanderi serovar Manhao 3 str. L 60 TaxID=1049759 RepID=V6I3S5_9LEPT|nr:hypothetical protein LEP1GSC062_3774 [Leptospira alexanderi serovar Manhao 3 str. L 60]
MQREKKQFKYPKSALVVMEESDRIFVRAGDSFNRYLAEG